MKNLKCLIYLFIPVFLISCATGGKRFKESKFLMGTIVEITTVGNESDCRQAMELAFGEIKRIDSLMNVYDEDSEISRINQAAGESAVAVSEDTFEVIDRAVEYADRTDGALDISVAPLMELWGFGSDKNQVPANGELKKRLSLVNYKNIIMDKSRSTVKLESPGMRIDVSGIAKGYAVDRAVQALKDAGVQSALVNAGGDIYAMSSPPGRDSWHIGIRNPRNRADLLGIVKLRDRAVATSGDYENFFEVDGKRYCHIIDPETGWPVSGIMSVTIVASDTTGADALATAVFPLGAEGGMKMIEELEGVEGVIVTGKEEDDTKVLLSSGMEDILQLMTD